MDDNADNIDVVATYLRVCGAAVLTAQNGIEALTFLTGDPVIDLLVTDLAMPGLNGIDLVRRLRAQPDYSGLPVIALSGFPEKYFAGDGERFSAFMLKPVDLDDRVATVKHLIATRVG